MEFVRVTNQPTETTVQPALLSEEDYRRFLKLLTWQFDERTGVLRVARKAPHLVGRVVVANTVFSVLPDIGPRQFVDMLLYSAGLDLSRFVDRERASVSAHEERGDDDFLILLAHLMVSVTASLAKGYLAKTYESKSELIQTVRGKPNWSRNFGRHPATGLICDYKEIQQDNLLNQLVLAGLEAATSILKQRETAHDTSVVFAWRSLCRAMRPTPTAFDLATKKLNRLTENYRPALTIARVILFGFTADNMFEAGQADLQCMQFDVSLMFERFLVRILRDHYRQSTIVVREQKDDGRAMVDGWSRTYRSVRPDILLRKGASTIAVLDAKYKPRYVETPPSKVTSEDLYQMFFYANRAKAQAAEKLRVGILAPQIGRTEVAPAPEDLIVRWTRPGEDSLDLDILPVELVAILEQLSDGVSASSALQKSSRLFQFCEQVAQ
jgi:5-methylcytosine-specific restriction endonuclease McrBC regulatory subunit McrC